jgi:amino acid transporter
LSPPEPSGTLLRGLRKWDLVALVINSVIGAGIFGLPSRVFALAGTYSVVAYLAATAAVFLIILCLAEVGSRFSTTGGPYLYAREAFGPAIGFQIGWLLWLARVTAFASLTNLFVVYLGYFLPAVVTEPWRSCIIVIVTTSLIAANIRGVRASAAVTNTFTVAKLIPLGIFTLVGLAFIDPQRYSPDAPDFRSFSQATLLLVFTFTGFEGATVPSGEMRDPSRQLPFALTAGMAIVAVVYVLVQIVSIGTLPNLAASTRPLADASSVFLGPPGAALIAAGALVSIVGTLNSILFATSRILFAMGEHRQLPAALYATHPRFRTPVLAISLTAGLALTLALFSTFLSALTISTVVRLVVYAASCAAMVAIRRRQDLPAAFNVPAGRLVAGVAIALCLWLLWSSPPAEALWAGMALLAGLAVQLACARAEKRR